MKRVLYLFLTALFLVFCVVLQRKNDSEESWETIPLSLEVLDELKVKARAGDTSAISRLFIEYSMFEKGGSNELYWIRCGAKLGEKNLIYIEEDYKAQAKQLGLDWESLDRIPSAIR